MTLATSIQTMSKPLRVSEATINISNLRLRTFIGFNPEEKSKQQDVIINLELRYCADSAFSSDMEEDALNYKIITKRMIHYVESGRFQLLEKLAADLLAIATESERVNFAEIRVDKPHALRFADSVSVTLNASRL
ncbi:MAG: dihydroneopterin triphosphate 2'-epimerase [Gammaproteobacteria bacterium]